ncbi:MAG: GNAT family N-acetyltransferase, partial [Actinomycetota bacterium]
LAAAAADRDWLRIGLLRDGDGRAIAFELNLLRDGAAVNLKLGYRESARETSPGLVLRGRVIDALIEEGAGTFDLLGRDEPYKLHWTERTVEHVRVRAFPPTMAGRARHLHRHRLRPAIGRMLGSGRTGPAGDG